MKLSEGNPDLVEGSHTTVVTEGNVAVQFVSNRLPLELDKNINAIESFRIR